MSWALSGCDGDASQLQAASGSPSLVPSDDSGDTSFWFATDGEPNDEARSSLPREAALAYLEQYRTYYGLSPTATDTVEVAQVHDTGRGGVIVQLRQAVGDVEVYGRRMSFLLDRDLALVAVSGGLHPAADRRAFSARFAFDDRRALGTALREAAGSAFDAATLEPVPSRSSGRLRRFSAASGVGFDMPQASVRRVLFPDGKKLRPAFAIELEIAPVGSSSSTAYAYVIAAEDGAILESRDLTFTEAAKYLVWVDEDEPHRPLDGPQGDLTPHPTGDVNTEVPQVPVARRTVSFDGFNTNPAGHFDPWLPAGAAETRGNNVDAYADHVSPDGFSAGDIRANRAGNGTFSWAFNPAQSPIATATQTKASITQIFFMTNWLHDWYYDSGFDEKAGNAQSDNFGRGGEDEDPLLAEGQDTKGDARNNANMSAPGDGLSPRMQMYIWDGPIVTLGESQLKITQPASVAGTYDVTPSSFGVDDEVTAAGSLVVVNDGAGGDGVSTDGCEPFVSSVANKIAMVDRGGCDFVVKAKNAEAKSAAGLIVVNNDAAKPDELPPLGGEAPAIAIPVLGVSKTVGAKLKQAASAGTVAAQLSRAGRERGADRDGTIDNSIVSHEWGHYLHHRLVLCGNKQCAAMSEGWGDFVALNLNVRDGDNLHGVYAKAAWSTGDAYFGIRRVPYSVEFDKNALTFKNISNGVPLPTTAPIRDFGPHAEIHNAGEVWATMMFEAYIALLEDAGHSFAEAQRRMSDYVVAGMKLAPPNPTFTEQRDAILAAAAANDPDDLQVLALAFARRGAGTGAASPPRNSTTFDGVKESFAISGDLAIVSATVEVTEDCDNDGNLDGSESGDLVISLINSGPIELSKTKVTVTGAPSSVSLPTGGSGVIGKLGGFKKVEARIPITIKKSLTAIATLQFEVEVTNAASLHKHSSGIRR